MLNSNFIPVILIKIKVAQNWDTFQKLKTNETEVYQLLITQQPDTNPSSPEQESLRHGFAPRLSK